MVDVEETEDVYLAIERGWAFISIFEVSYNPIKHNKIGRQFFLPKSCTSKLID